MTAPLLAPAHIPVAAVLALIAALMIRNAGRDADGLADTQCLPVEFLEEPAQ